MPDLVAADYPPGGHTSEVWSSTAAASWHHSRAPLSEAVSGRVNFGVMFIPWGLPKPVRKGRRGGRMSASFPRWI